MARRTSGGRRSATFFQQLIERRAREGLTWAEAANAGGTSLSTLHRWAQRLRSTQEPEFVELSSGLVRSAAPAVAIEIVLSNGRILRVPPGAPPAGLIELVHLLEGAC